MKLRFASAAALLAFTTPLTAEEFDFASFGDRIPAEVQQGYGKFSQPFFTKENTPFTAGFVDLKAELSAKSVNPEMETRRQVNLFAAPGTYAGAGFVVEANADVADIAIRVTALTASSGTLPPEQLLLRRIVANVDGTPLRTPLLIPFAGTIPRLTEGEYFHGYIYVNVPLTTPPGQYRGAITVRSGPYEENLTLSLTVPDFTLPETEGSFGFFLSAPFDGGLRPNGAPAPAMPGYDAERMQNMMYYWRKLGLNSPMVLDLVYWREGADGKLEYDFSVAELYADAMKKAGMKGALCLDNSFRLDELKNELKRTGSPLSAVDFAVGGIRAILAEAEAKQWPKLMFVIEEEMGNGWQSKIDNYNAFQEPLRMAFPDHTYVVDNSIGWGNQNAIDYGNRDDFKVIEYNSWTALALQTAHENGREVWLYNGGTNRGMFGLRLCAIGGTGAHQWAEMWNGKDGYNWVYLIFDADGRILPTLTYEEIYKGLLDYRYYHYLQTLAGRLQQAGKTVEAAVAEAVLRDVTADIPPDNNGGNAWEKKQSDAANNLRTWRMICAIRSARAALGEADNPPEGIADVSAVQVQIQSVPAPVIAGTAMIKLPKITAGRLDVVADIATEENGTGPLTWPNDQINRLRAFASDEEDFKKRFQPSWTTANLYYDDQGIYIWSHQNGGGWDYEASTHEDEDRDLWQDPFSEIDFQLPGQLGYYQLMVNTKGKKSFTMHGGENPAAIAANVKTFTQKDDSGAHIEQEVFIPWRCFELKEMPKAGTLWKFNFARYIRWKNELQTWSPINEMFNEVNSYGYICFTGASGKSILEDPRFTPLQIGRNTFSAKIHPPEKFSDADIEVNVLDPMGNVVATANPGIRYPGRFETTVTLDKNAPGGDYVVRIIDKTTQTVLENVAWPNQAGNLQVCFMAFPSHTIGNAGLEFQLSLPVTDTSIGQYPLCFTLTAGNERLPLPPVISPHGGMIRVRLKDLRLPAGKAVLEVKLGDLTDKPFDAAQEFTVLPEL